MEICSKGVSKLCCLDRHNLACLWTQACPWALSHTAVQSHGVGHQHCCSTDTATSHCSGSGLNLQCQQLPANLLSPLVKSKEHISPFPLEKWGTVSPESRDVLQGITEAVLFHICSPLMTSHFVPVFHVGTCTAQAHSLDCSAWFYHLVHFCMFVIVYHFTQINTS